MRSTTFAQVILLAAVAAGPSSLAQTFVPSGPAVAVAPPGATEAVVPVDIDSDPAGAEVFVEGAFIGSTPLHAYGLPAGTHELRMRKRRFQEWTRVLTVNAGSPTYVRAELERLAAAPVLEAPTPAKRAEARPSYWFYPDAWLMLHGVASGPVSLAKVFFAIDDDEIEAEVRGACGEDAGDQDVQVAITLVDADGSPVLQLRGKDEIEDGTSGEVKLSGRIAKGQLERVVGFEIEVTAR